MGNLIVTLRCPQQREFVNLDTENTYKSDSKVKVPPILSEFSHSLQKLLDSELTWQYNTFL